MNVVNETLSRDRCIGCGICRSVCPVDAITIKYSNLKENIPIIDSNKCIDCSICVKYCPHSLENTNDLIQNVFRNDNLNNFGVSYSDALFLAHVDDERKRVNSASGGIVTALAQHLIANNIVDAIIHAEPLSGKIGEQHYKASISYSVDEIENKRSSFYGPINFDDILLLTRNENKKFLIIGVPCVIRGITKLYSNHNLYNKNNVITLALACSHNVSGLFIDYLAESLGINQDTPFKVNLRNKDDIKDANNFNNHFYNEKETLAKENRYKTLFTSLWRSYFFAINTCNYCCDFWGSDADISVKDAWGKWSGDPLGKSIVVSRKKWMTNLLNNVHNVKLESLTYEEVVNSQTDTTTYKQVELDSKNNKNLFSISNIKNGLFLNTIIMKYSKDLYIKYGYRKSITIFRVMFLYKQIIAYAKRGYRKIGRMVRNGH